MTSETRPNEIEETAAESPAPWESTPPQVHRYREPADVADAAARRFLETAQRAVHRSGRFIVVLAGGHTPRPLYTRLTEPPFRDKVPWNKTLFLFGDERCVPPDAPESNFRMAQEMLFEPLGIDPVRIFRMKGEQAPAEAAQRYEVRLSDLFLGGAKRHFDLVLLGVGEDGHTASLFPGTAALDERERFVVANHVPKLDAWRLTLTLPALNSARRVLFLATGESKARVVAEAFGGLAHDDVHPCERVCPPNARREVLVDAAAAGLLHGETSEAG